MTGTILDVPRSFNLLLLMLHHYVYNKINLVVIMLSVHYVLCYILMLLVITLVYQARFLQMSIANLSRT